jgi:outer membrane protein
MGARLKTSAERFEKDGPIMSETDRVRRQRELAEMDREFQRKQREFREDFNQRRNEELQALLERTNRIIRQIAEQEKFDLIIQEAVYFNPRIDMTERVLRALNNAK